LTPGPALGLLNSGVRSDLRCRILDRDIVSDGARDA
jgi:hypothetical protein